RLDRLAEADLVGEEDARRVPRGDVARDRELVWEEVDAAAEETAHRRAANARELLQRFDAKRVNALVVDLSAAEARLGRTHVELVGELLLRQRLPGAAIDEAALLL